MRRLSLFALIFIVLAGLYWLLEGRGGENSREPDHLLKGFEPANVARITITGPQKEMIVLQRNDRAWLVSADGPSYTADSPAVQALLDSLKALTTGSMVSRNPDRHALYEVSLEAGLRVEALDRDKRALAAVLIGKSGPNIFSTYVRNDDSDHVYLVDGLLQNAAAKSLNEWRDKTIFSFKPGQVRDYAVRGDRDLVLHKSAAAWQAGADNTPVDAEAVDRVVRAFANLSAANFAEGPLEEFGLAAPAQTVTAQCDDGEEAVLLLGKDVNAFQQYAKTADDETIYIVEKHILGMLCPTMEELKIPEAEEDVPAETPSALSL